MRPEPEHPLAAPVPGLTHPWLEPPEGGTSILAHLHYLEAEGQATRLVGTDGIHRFRKA